MKLKQNPLFRRIITPWWDADGVCLLVIYFMIAVVYFSMAGIVTAVEYPEFRGYIWLPILLWVLSMAVILSIGHRLVSRRLAHRHR